MTDQIQFIETNDGKLAMKIAKSKLVKRGVPLTSDEVACVEDFLLQVSGITVPSALAGKTAATSPELAEAKAAFDATLQIFFEDTTPPEDIMVEDHGTVNDPRSGPSGSSARLLVS